MVEKSRNGLDLQFAYRWLDSKSENLSSRSQSRCRGSIGLGFLVGDEAEEDLIYTMIGLVLQVGESRPAMVDGKDLLQVGQRSRLILSNRRLEKFWMSISIGPIP